MSVDANWIERVIYAKYTGNHEYIMPTATPPGWWECDIFSLTKAGYMNEFEIKVSRSDFKADWKKGLGPYTSAKHRGFDMRKCRGRTGEFKKEWEEASRPVLKHDLLAEKCTKGPTYFWFCTPDGLLKTEDIPEYAGHIVFPDVADGVSPWTHACMNVAKKAPALHRDKFSEKRLKTLTYRIMYRYQQMYFVDRPRWIREAKIARQDLKLTKQGETT